MINPFHFGVGGVVSADIAVPNHSQQLEFYSSILTSGSTPLWQSDLMNNQGTPIIGLGQQTPEYDMLPLQWMPHFQVKDVAESVDRALELGGKELIHGRDDAGSSLWACVMDPEGSAFGMIPVVEQDDIELEQLDSIGHIAGLTLVASDVPLIQDFYSQVIGWASLPAEIFGRNQSNQNIPTLWMMSLPVGDLNESLIRVREGGGQVVQEEAGSDAVIQDPIGVYLALQQGA